MSRFKAASKADVKLGKAKIKELINWTKLNLSCSSESAGEINAEAEKLLNEKSTVNENTV